MKTRTRKSIALPILLIVLGLLVCATAFALAGGRLNLVYDTVERAYPVDGEFSEFSVKAVSADVTLALSDDGSCRIECAEAEFMRVSTEIKNGVLYIEHVDQREWYNKIFSFTKPMRMTVYLPRPEYTAATIKSVSGSVSIPFEAFSFENAEVASVSGSIKVLANVRNHLTVESVSGSVLISDTCPLQLKAESVSGGIHISGTKNAFRLQAESVSGKLLLENIECGELDAETTSGKIELTNVIADSIECETTSGAIVLSASDAKKLEIESTSGAVRASLLSGKTFKTKSTSGKISVPADFPSGGACEITTISGGITVSIEP